MIRAIIFDCFGVLTQDYWKAFWTALPTKEIRSQARQLNKDHDSGLLTLEEYIRQLAELTAMPVNTIKAVVTGSGMMKNTQLLDYIIELKKDYKIGILSNVGTSWIEDTLLSVDEQALFDSMIFSYRVSMTKPDPQIYLLAASRLDVTPSECVFVDDISAYCEVAEKIGMKSIVYDSFSDFKKMLMNILSS